MRDFRLGSGYTAHYSSIEELANAYKLKPISKQTKDKEKLNAQRDKFKSRHRCKGCGEPMEWIGDNVMVCKNPKCKGIKHEYMNEDGNKNIAYSTSYDLLDELGSEIAKNIFSERA